MKCIVKKVVCLVVGLCALQIDASQPSGQFNQQQDVLYDLHASPEQIEYMIQTGKINPTLFTDGVPASVGGFPPERTALELLLMQRAVGLQQTCNQQQELLTVAQQTIKELQKQVEIARQGKSDSLTDAMAAVT